MSVSRNLMAGVAALALIACGGDGGDSRQAARTSAASPLEATFSLKDGAPVDVEALFALFPEEAQPTYDSAAFDDDLGATVVTNLRFAISDGESEVTIDRAELFGVDLEAVQRIEAAEGAAADAPFETVFQKVRLIGVSAECLEDDAEKPGMTIGGVEFDMLKMRQGGVDGDGVGDEGARFFNAVEMAGLYFKDIDVTVREPDAPTISFSAPDLRFVDMAGGKMNAMIAKDLEYGLVQTEQSLESMRKVLGPEGAAFLDGPLRGFVAPDTQRVKIKSMEWRGIDFSGLLAWGLRGEEPPMTAERLIDLGTFKAVDLETFVGNKRAASVEETTMSAAEFTWLIPSNVRMDTKGAFYDFTAYISETEEAALGVMKEYGLDDVTGDGYAEWTWNSGAGEAKLDYVANMNGLADFSMNAAFSGLKLNDLAAAQADGEENILLSNGSFDSFSLTLEDENALDAIFALSALQMGGTGEDLRQSAPAMMRLAGVQAAQFNPRISDYINAAAEFIGKGGALDIMASPAAPVSFVSLQSTGVTAPQTLPDVLDLKITHKE